MRRLTALLAFSLVSAPVFGDLFQERIDRTIKHIREFSSTEIHAMSRHTVRWGLNAFGEGVEIIRDVYRDPKLTLDEKKKILSPLFPVLAEFFIDMGEPYQNISRQPPSLAQMQSGAHGFWETSLNTAGWAGLKAVYIAENLFRDLSRVALPFRRDERGELHFSVPPVFPFWGNDWARSDATEEMSNAILKQIKLLVGKDRTVSDAEREELTAYAQLLYAMQPAEQIANGAQNNWIWGTELFLGVGQNFHPLDWLGGFGLMMDENSTFVSGVVSTFLLVLAAKSRVENTGLKSYSKWRKATALLQKAGIACGEHLRLAAVVEPNGSETQVAPKPRTRVSTRLRKTATP